MSLSRRDLWTERMARYRTSSLTVKEFCAAEGVSQPSFYQWKKRLTEDRSAAPSTFVPISLDAALSTSATMRLPGGAEIELPAAIGQDELKRIIAAVVSVTRNGTAS